MADTLTLAAARRSDTGKGAARSIRRTGRVPAVIYGHDRPPEPLVVDAAAVERLLAGVHAASTLFDLAVDGGAPVKALIREIQRNPLQQSDILHLDFFEVRANEKVTVEIPIHLTGTADGVRNFGGVLDQVMHKLQIRVLPADLPGSIDLDVTTLGIGKSLFVRDLKLERIEVMHDGSLPICSVVAPRTEEAAPVETAEAPAEPELIRKPKPEEEGETAE
jgi:large subunit ribosomal protein L25